MCARAGSRSPPKNPAEPLAAAGLQEAVSSGKGGNALGPECSACGSRQEGLLSRSPLPTHSRNETHPGTPACQARSSALRGERGGRERLRPAPDPHSHSPPPQQLLPEDSSRRSGRIVRCWVKRGFQGPSTAALFASSQSGLAAPGEFVSTACSGRKRRWSLASSLGHGDLAGAGSAALGGAGGSRSKHMLWPPRRPGHTAEPCSAPRSPLPPPSPACCQAPQGAAFQSTPPNKQIPLRQALWPANFSLQSDTRTAGPVAPPTPLGQPGPGSAFSAVEPRAALSAHGVVSEGAATRRTSCTWGKKGLGVLVALLLGTGPQHRWLCWIAAPTAHDVTRGGSGDTALEDPTVGQIAKPRGVAGIGQVEQGLRPCALGGPTPWGNA